MPRTARSDAPQPSVMDEIGDPAHVGALVTATFREASVFRAAIRLSPGVYTVTYVAGLPPVERTVIARVTRHERQTYIDWLHGDVPDELADQAVRFGLTAHVEAEERAAVASAEVRPETLTRAQIEYLATARGVRLEDGAAARRLLAGLDGTTDRLLRWDEKIERRCREQCARALAALAGASA